MANAFLIFIYIIAQRIGWDNIEEGDCPKRTPGQPLAGTEKGFLDTSLRWKVDIWALPPAVIASNQGELDQFRQKRIPEKRRLITHEGRTPSLSGYPICCAVPDRVVEV